MDDITVHTVAEPCVVEDAFQAGVSELHTYTCLARVTKVLERCFPYSIIHTLRVGPFCLTKSLLCCQTVSRVPKHASTGGLN